MAYNQGGNIIAADYGVLVTPRSPVRVTAPLSTAITISHHGPIIPFSRPYCKAGFGGSRACVALALVQAVLSFTRHRFYVSRTGAWGEANHARSGPPVWEYISEEDKI